MSPEDAFVATTWWTAHVANAAVRSLGRERFLYLIQEYEPFTFPMGSWAALAMSSYEFPHVAMFSSEMLRAFFAERSYGVFRDGRESGEASSISFQNAITAISPPTEAEMAGRTRRRLLFYARPEGHGSRNMFELGLLGLSEAIASGASAGIGASLASVPSRAPTGSRSVRTPISSCSSEATRPPMPRCSPSTTSVSP